MLRSLALAGAAALCFTLSSCSFMPVGPEDLMRPPKLTPLQAEIDNALKNALGTKDLTLKYPLSGDFRSAYVLHNLDGDPEEEAVVFYQLNTGDSSIRISVLDQQPDGSWALAYTTIGGGEDVLAVRFAPILNREQDDMILSWSQQGKGSPSVVVYSYENGRLDDVYSGTGDSIYLVDSNEDGYHEMVLLNKGGTRDPSVQLVRRVGRKLIAKSDIYLNPTLTDFAGATFGRTADGSPAIFIDEVVDNRTYATEVVTIEDRKLVNRMRTNQSVDSEEPEDLALYESTMRPSGVVSRDVDGDGIVEIPTQSLLPGYREDQEGEQLYLTTYNVLDDEELSPSVHAVLNDSMGYTFLFPSTWRGNVTVKRVHESGEWRFVVYDGTLENSTIELLRIRVSSHQDYQDKFETESYFTIAKKGIFEYSASIPTKTHPLSITEEEVHTLFHLNQESSSAPSINLAETSSTGS